MRKLLIFFFSVALAWSVARAVPAKPGFHTFTQSDGTEITVQTVGDEWLSSIVTRDGLTVERDDNGDFFYRTPAGRSSVRAHNPKERDHSETAWISANAGQLTLEARNTPQVRALRASARKAGGPMKVGSTQVPTTGSPRVPIIVIEYSDKKLSNDISAFRSHYTSGSSSAYQYFADQSNGKYTPQYDVYGPYTLDKARAEYGNHGTDNRGNSVNDVGVGAMVGDAIDKAGNDINWSQYDNDGDGEADVCIVVYAGVGEAQASTTVPSSIWPCQWNLYSANYYGDGTGPRTRNGVTINRFAVFNEVNGSRDSGTTLDGVGTFCHEFSHCLGLPDFYDTNYGGHVGMSEWSLMNSGCYNNNGHTPIGYSAYEKEFMGWISYITPQPSTQYNLAVFNQKNEATDQAIKVVSDKNANEYFILENRKKQGWDAYIRDEGVMISHVSYVASRWNDNTLNNEDIQLMTIVPADGAFNDYSLGSDLYGESNHAFTDDSSPAATLNMTSSGLASSTGGAGKLGKPITDIYLNSDGTASLWYMKEGAPLETPILGEATQVKGTQFTARWTDDRNSDCTYTLEVTRRGAYELLLTEDMSDMTTSYSNIANSLNSYMDNSGWTGSYLYPRSGYIQLGNGYSQTGTLTSPALDLSKSGGKVTVEITVASNGSDPLVVSCGDASQNVSDLTTSFATKTLVLNCNAATNQKVTFKSSNSYTIVGISDIKIYSGDASQASQAPSLAPSESGDATHRLITGITAKSYTVENLTEGETYNFRVKAVPVDDSALESAWSTTKQVTLIQPAPEVIVDPERIEMGEHTVGGNATKPLGVLASDLTGEVTLTLANEHNVFTLEKNTLTIEEAQEGAEVNVTFAPTLPGDYTATVTVSTPGAESVTATLHGTAVPAPLEKHNPVLLTADEALVGNTSFTATWTDDTPADNVVSYTLQVDEGSRDSQVVEIAHEDFSNLTWSKTGTTSQADEYLRLGNSSRSTKGGVNSPALTPFRNKVTVKVAAHAFSSTAATMKVLLRNTGGTELTSQSFTLDSEKKEYVALLDATAGTPVVVRIENSSYGVCLYEATVYSGDATAQAPAAAVSETGDASSRTITGITGKSYTVEGLTAGDTYTYKVKALYADDTESHWSNLEEVTLKEEAPAPALTVEPTQVAINDVVEGETATATFTVTGSNLQDAIHIALEGAPDISIDKTVISADEAQNATVTVTFAPASAGSYTATATLTTTGAEPVTVNISATAVMKKDTPQALEVSGQDITKHSFVAQWTAVPNVQSYTLQVNPDGTDNLLIFDNLTETAYEVKGLTPGTTYDFHVKAVYTDGDESLWSNMVSVTTSMMPGDVNDDEKINVMDYVFTASHILEQNPQPFIFAAADLNGDKTVDVQDLVGVTRLALGFEGDTPAGAPATATAQGRVDMSATARGATIVIDMTNSLAISALQIDIDVPAGVEVTGATLSGRAAASHNVALSRLSNGSYRVLASSSAARAIAGNDGELLTLALNGDACGTVTLSHILLATPQAACLDHDDIVLDMGTTGVGNVAVDAVRIYGRGHHIVVETPTALQVQVVLPSGKSFLHNAGAGINEIEAPASGPVIVKAGSQVSKIQF